MLAKTDEHLIQKALRGHKRSWLSLVKRYEAPLYNYALRMTGHSTDAMDLMQEIFISVFKSLETFRGNSSFKTWMFRIAHYKCVDHLRKKVVERDEREVDDIACEHSGPQAHLFALRGMEQLQQALSQLPFSQQEVVELKYFQGFTFDEIAQQVGVSANTVKTRLYSALAKLKHLVEFDHDI